MEFQPQKLKNLRKTRGYSLGVVSRLLEARFGHKVSRSAICHWENGNFFPSISSLTALAELYEVDMNEFFDFDYDDYEPVQNENQFSC